MESRPDEPRGTLESVMQQLQMQQERWEQQQKESRRELREIVLATTAVLAALFTGWQGYEAHRARVDAIEDAKEARRDAQAAMLMQFDATKASQAQAERSAQAAESSAAIAAQSLHVSERAYVDIDAGVTSTPKAGEKLSFLAYFANSGRTPALDVVTNVRSEIVPASVTAEQAHSKAFGSTAHVPPYSSKSALAPNTKIQTSWQTDAPLSQAELEGLTKRQMLVYVFARVTYKDEFQRPHETNFCGLLNLADQGGRLLRCSSLNSVR